MPSSCRCPSRSVSQASLGHRSRTAISTASPASNSPLTATIPTGSRLALPSRNALRGALVDHERAVRGLRVLQPQLERAVPGLPRREHRPLAPSLQHRLQRPLAQAVADHRRDPRRRGHVGGDDLRAHPARAQRRGRVADLQLLKRLEVASPPRPAPRSRPGADRRCRGRRCRSAAPADRRPRASPPAPPGSRCRRRRSRPSRSCRSRSPPPPRANPAACARSGGHSDSASERSDRRSSAAPARSSPRARATARHTPCTASPAPPRSRPAAHRSPPGAPEVQHAHSPRDRAAGDHHDLIAVLSADSRRRRRSARAPPREARRCPRRRCSTPA